MAIKNKCYKYGEWLKDFDGILLSPHKGYTVKKFRRNKNNYRDLKKQ
jgi:hypothetical protein